MDRSPRRTGGTYSPSQTVLQKAQQLRMDPSASRVVRKDNESLVTEEDRDFETTKLSPVSRGNADPESDFKSLVELISEIQVQYQNNIFRMRLEGRAA